MIKGFLFGFMGLAFIFLIYEIGYVHGFENAESMNNEKGEKNEKENC